MLLIPKPAGVLANNKDSLAHDCLVDCRADPLRLTHDKSSQVNFDPRITDYVNLVAGS